MFIFTGICTGIGVVVGGITIVFVFLTFREAKKSTETADSAATAAWKAVEEAQRSAKAAEDAVKVSSETGQAQARAYIQMGVFQVFLDCDRELLAYKFNCENLGVSPATNPRAVIKVEAYSTENKRIEGIASVPFDTVFAGKSSEIPYCVGSEPMIPKKIFGSDYSKILQITFTACFLAEDVFGNTIYTTRFYAMATPCDRPKNGTCDLNVYFGPPVSSNTLQELLKYDLNSGARSLAKGFGVIESTVTQNQNPT